MKNKIELLSVLAVFALFAVIAVPSVSATYPANAVYFEPEDSTGEFCENTYVQIMVNTSVKTTGAGMDIYFDPNCVNITDIDFTGTPYNNLANIETSWKHWGNYIREGVLAPEEAVEPGIHLVATLTLHCEKEAAECTSDLVFTETELLDEEGGPLSDVTWHDGTFTCEIVDIWMCGDVNGDRAVNVIDVVLIYKRALDPGYPLDRPWAGDVNCDHNINVIDVVLVYKRALDPGYDLNCCCEGSGVE